MSEGKDPAIKLFGKTIQLPDNTVAPPPSSECEDPTPCSPNHSLSEEDRSLSTGGGGGGGAEEDSGKDPLEVTADDSKAEDVARSMKSQELTDPNLVKENLEAASVDDVSAKASKNEEQNETGNGQDKTPKKPDKIIPCPRCNSMDTKFCYYNNYNMNQPRHFCKNCQRYWTAGGTRRNVPVGAGRRKNKNTSSQYRHINGPEPLQTAHPDLSNGVHYPALKPNGTVLTFGTDAPLCESMESVLSIAEKAARNVFHRPEELRIPNPYGTGGNGEDQSNVFAVAVSSSDDEASKDGLPEKLIPNYHGIPPQISCFPGAPWPYPWNLVQWSHPIAPAAFCPGSFPMPFYPAAPYWDCAVPGTWNVHWVNPPNASQSHTPPTSGPNSQTLGKHSRDDSMLKSTDSDKEESQKESNTEKCLWFPKTLRLGDPGEAARSSIWATLGIKHDKVDSVGGGGLFKAFRSKGDEKPNVSETCSVLQANPAAFSRSLSFRESS